MKVLFSNPPWWETKSDGSLIRGVRAGSRWPFTYATIYKPDFRVFGEYLPYPFFLGYAASYCLKHTGAMVRMRDSIALREGYQKYFEDLKTEQFDFIFVESASPSWEHDAKIISRIPKVSPHTKIVVTGPITAIKSKEILERLPVIACIQGEYEKGSLRVLQGATGILDHDLLTTAEMNAAPFPYYEAKCAPVYFDANPQGQKFPHAHVWSSRGCPFKCIFCVWPATMTGDDPDGTNKRTVRHYTPEYMLEFLTQLIERFHYKSIYFDDDTFNLGNSHVLKMCEVMRNINLPWSAMCRADTIKMETWKEMKESGCFGVKLGFESGNQWVVDNIVNKHLNLAYASEVVHELKRLGMTVHGTFTYGLPGETKEQMMETRKFRLSLPLDSFQESGTAEIEGTPLHTLRTKGHLDAYKEAKMDTAYSMHQDGNKKIADLAHQLAQT